MFNDFAREQIELTLKKSKHSMLSDTAIINGLEGIIHILFALKCFYFYNPYLYLVLFLIIKTLF